MPIRTIVVLLCSLAVGCSANAPLDDARVSERTQSAIDLGRLPADTEVDFVVGLSLRNRTALQRLLAERQSGDDVLAPEEFAGSYAPTTQEYARVVAWLRAHGVLV